MANDSWSGQDKAQHFIASAMLSAAEDRVARTLTQAECQRYLYVAHCPSAP